MMWQGCRTKKQCDHTLQPPCLAGTCFILVASCLPAHCAQPTAVVAAASRLCLVMSPHCRLQQLITWVRHMGQAHGSGTWVRHMGQAHGSGTWVRLGHSHSDNTPIPYSPTILHPWHIAVHNLRLQTTRAAAHCTPVAAVLAAAS
jgi:hypothetical protein